MTRSLTISEFARRAGVTASALRFYERRGLIEAERTSGNQRRYQRAQLRQVAFIRSAQRVGVGLDEISRALADLPRSRVPTREDWARLSAAWLERLDERIRSLERLRDDLTGCIGCGCLSLETCALYNKDDALAAEGPGPRRLLDG